MGPIKRKPATVFQANIGLHCNQASRLLCAHACVAAPFAPFVLRCFLQAAPPAPAWCLRAPRDPCLHLRRQQARGCGKEFKLALSCRHARTAT